MTVFQFPSILPPLHPPTWHWFLPPPLSPQKIRHLLIPDHSYVLFMHISVVSRFFTITNNATVNFLRLILLCSWTCLELSMLLAKLVHLLYHQPPLYKLWKSWAATLSRSEGKKHISSSNFSQRYIYWSHLYRDLTVWLIIQHSSLMLLRHGRYRIMWTDRWIWRA